MTPGKSVGIWAGGFDGQAFGVVRDAACELDSLGYDALWLPETTGREAMSQAALLLSVTARITVATGAALVYARDAVTTAAAHRTLAEAFPGRFVLGLAIGHPALVTDVRGHPFTPPVATMRRYLDALAEASVRPVVAALGPRMLALAGTAAGALSLGMPVEHTRSARGLVGEGRFLGVTQLVVMEDDPAVAERLAWQSAEAAMPNRRELLRGLGYTELDRRLVDALVVRGGAGEVARRVAGHHAAGADQVNLHLVTAAPAPPVGRWRALAEVLL